ncbi:MAG TPA: FAD-dependent oxidoreductase [Fibrobacteria bacterium]|nr:FAD-dependent oxidoreductase [Fibrobacteria bacterium]
MSQPHRYLVREIALPVGASEEGLSRAVAEYLRLPAKSVGDLRIVRKSLDARARNRPVWRYAVEFASERSLNHPRATPVTATPPSVPATKHTLPGKNVAVVGSGPAGLAASLGLARKGYAVTVFEMGKGVVERFRDIRRHVKQGVLDPKSNILFGLGGAGTFSDGKLTARTRNAHTDAFLKDLVACGADASIEYLHHPHLGTDRLQFIVDNYRKLCEAAGCTFRFGTEVTDLLIESGRCVGVAANGESLRFDAVAVAPGLSAHGLYRALAARGVTMERKAFAVGVRVEHPQALINARQLGDRVDAKVTGAAEYFLTWQNDEGAAAYSFCMCPGGVVVPCADAEGALFTNGMSYSNRGTAFANSAVVAAVDPARLGGDVLAGLDYQLDMERRAYALGGGDGTWPAQTIAAFVEGRKDEGPMWATSFQSPLRWADFHELFDAEVSAALRASFLDFERKIPGFVAKGLMIGPESRTSSPVRIPRDPESFESVSLPGLYPLGEGAGYSGGIVSSGADGVRFAVGVEEWNKKNDGMMK